MIRKLTPADAAAWKAFRIEMLTDTPHSFGATLAETTARSVEDFAAMLAKTSVFVDETTQFRASAAWSPLPAEADSHRAFLFSVYVRPEYRGQGLIDPLIDAACEEARSRGQVQIELNVNATLEGAIRVYKRHGFQPYGFLPRALKINGVMSDDVLMWKKLD